MRRITWVLLIAFVFAMPWEYSLDFGPSAGDIARLLGLAVLLFAIPSILQTRSMRMPGPVQWITLGVFAWFCLTLFWSVNPDATMIKLRGYFQELMIVWLLWEFVSTAEDLRIILRTWLAGSWVLAGLTTFTFVTATAANRIRFMPIGQDPNDVARYLDLALPIAAYLLIAEDRWHWRLHALGYFPLALAAVILTASRAGVLVAVIALMGSCLLLVMRYPRGFFASFLALGALSIGFLFTVPEGTIGRIATTLAQLNGGDLNQRANIWQAGWTAFTEAPLTGTGAGTFVEASGLSPIDTAHNTALSVAVEGGLIALMLGTSIAAFALLSTWTARQPLRGALLTAFAVWLCLSMVGTTGESRKTWLLFGVMALAGRLCARPRDPAPVPAAVPMRATPTLGQPAQA